jgi:hypothetical protein
MASELIELDLRELARKQLEHHEREARRLRNILAAYDSEDDIPSQEGKRKSMMRWLRKNGKPMRPFDVIRIILREHGGEMPTIALYELMDSGGASEGKGNPESAFKLSIQTNVKLDKLIQVDDRGKEMTWQEIQDLEPPTAILTGITRLKT